MGGWELLERLGFKVPPLTDARVETFFQASTRLERAALTDLPEARALLATSGTERVELVKQCATLFQRHAGTPSYFARQRTQELFDALAESSLPYADDDLAILLRLCSDGTEGAT